MKSSTSDELISGSDASLCDESTDTSLDHAVDGGYSATPLMYTIVDPECRVDPSVHTMNGTSHHSGLKDEPEDVPCSAKGGLDESMDGSWWVTAGTCIHVIGPDVPACM